MYKHSLLVIFLAFLLITGIFASPSLFTLDSHTQSAQAAESNSMQSQGTNDTGQREANPTLQEWLWIVPIAALPFLAIPFRKKKQDEELDSQLWPYEQYSVGTKGGKSRIELENDEFL